MFGKFREVLAARRTFLSHWFMEILVVAIGISIAFALQEWAGDIASKRRGADAETRIRDELLHNAAIAMERIAVHPCLHRQLVDLMKGVSSAEAGWRPQVGRNWRSEQAAASVYLMPSRTLVIDSYQGALTGGDLASVSPARRASLAGIYADLPKFNALNEEEFALAAQLKPLQFDLPLGADARSVMLGRLARLDDIDVLMRLMAEQYLEGLRRHGIRPDAAEFNEVRAGWAALEKRGRDKYGACWDARAIGKLDARLVR